MSTVVRSGADYYDVYLGFWINWSNGRIRGSTVTLSRQSGGLLIAFLAIFIGASGKSFWRISCFVIHRWLSSGKAQDALYHQRQAILRNSDSAEDTALNFMHASFAWKGRARRPYYRLMPVVVFALITSAAFGLAGIFSSRVTTETGSEVLLTGNNCGVLDSSDPSTPSDYSEYLRTFEPYDGARTTAYLNHALQCYTDAANSEDCHLYVKQKERINVTPNATCPFDDSMCLTQDGNLILDTGYLDSHHDLGINAPQEKRFQIRLVNQCAPIATQNFTKVHNNSNSPYLPVMRYYYGKRRPAKSTPNDTEPFTFEAPMNFSTWNLDDASSRSVHPPDYSLSQITAHQAMPATNGVASFSDFTPIPQLNRTDADVTLFFLSGDGIRFAEPINDLWYSAHGSGLPVYDTLTNESSPSYSHDGPVRVLGCAIQRQFCNPNLPKEQRCEPLRGERADYTPSMNFMPQLWEDPDGRDRMEWVLRVMLKMGSNLDDVITNTGISALKSRSNLVYGYQGGLPDNQWQQEVQHWLGAVLSSVQGTFVETANGPPLKAMQPWSIKPTTEEGRQMCANQKIMSTRYSSFNVLGIAIILVFGGLLMILDLCIESFFERLCRLRKDPRSVYARIEWQANSILQLQRLAHEEIGMGTWEGAAKTIPITGFGQSLAVLDTSDEGHPVFVKGMGDNKSFASEGDLEKGELVRIDSGPVRTHDSGKVDLPTRIPD